MIHGAAITSRRTRRLRTDDPVSISKCSEVPTTLRSDESPPRSPYMSEPTHASPVQLFDLFFRPTLFTPWARSLLQRAAPQPGEHVLDLACGTGTVAQFA